MSDQTVNLDEACLHAHQRGEAVLVVPPPSPGGAWSAQFVKRTRSGSGPATGTEESLDRKQTTTDGLKPTLGHLSESSPRAATWQRIFGATTIPLRSPVTSKVEIRGVGKKDVYMLDLARLKPEQFDRLVLHLAETNSMPPEDVRGELTNDGILPILADDVGISFDGRLVL